MKTWPSILRLEKSSVTLGEEAEVRHGGYTTRLGGLLTSVALETRQRRGTC